QGVLGEAEAEPFAPGAERTLDRDARGVSSQARKARAQTHGHVNGMLGRERLPRAMRHGGSRTGALAARTPPTPSPRAERELVLAQPMSMTLSMTIHEKHVLHP